MRNDACNYWPNLFIAEIPKWTGVFNEGWTVRTKLNSVARELYEDIAIGVFGFGCKLAEERLAERYGTKRHIVRDAFVHLELIGYVERIPNRGVFVNEPSPSAVRETYEVRTVLERHAARSTSLPVPAAISGQLERIQEKHTRATRDGNYRAVLQLNAEFHRVQFSACKNATLATTIKEFATSTHQITAMKFGHADDMEEVIKQHHAIIEAMKGNDIEVLVSAIMTHYNLSRVDEYAAHFRARHGVDDFPDPSNRRLRIL